MQWNRPEYVGKNGIKKGGIRIKIQRKYKKNKYKTRESVRLVCQIKQARKIAKERIAHT